MALPTGVHKRGAVFHIQIKVPSDLKASWPTPFYVRKSLATEDRAEATAAGHRLWAEATEAFAGARLKLAPPPLTALTPTLTAYIVGEAARVPLGADDVVRFTPHALLWQLQAVDLPPMRFLTGDEGEGARLTELPDYLAPSKDGAITPAQLSRLKHLQSLRVDDLAASVSMGRLGEAKAFAESTCASLGIRVDWDAPAHRMALVAILRALLEAWIGAAGRSQGQLVHTPAPPEVPSAEVTAPVAPTAPKTSRASTPKLMDMLADWKAASRPTEDSIQRTERALRHLEASGQNVPLKDLKRTHGAAVRAYLLDEQARGFKAKTALNLWQSLGALLNVAHDVGKIETNPWRGMAFEVTGSKQRLPFSDEELQTLFGSTLHTEGRWPVVQKVVHWDAYFCMLLLVWTGARVGELAQLEVADVKLQNGLHVFSIHDEAEGSTVKGGSLSPSVRTVPVPPDVVRLGFLERVEDLKKRGESKLFPSFHRPGAVTPGEIMSEWFRPFRVAVGAATGALNGTHRFRHTIRTRLAALNVGVETADALTGHAAKGSAGRTDYTHVAPATVKAALERVVWPLVLPKVYQYQTAIEAAEERAVQ